MQSHIHTIIIYYGDAHPQVGPSFFNKRIAVQIYNMSPKICTTINKIIKTVPHASDDVANADAASVPHYCLVSGSPTYIKEKD